MATTSQTTRDGTLGFAKIEKKQRSSWPFPPFFLTRQEETAEYLPHAALNKPPRAQRLRRQNLERKLSDIFQEGKKPFDSFHFISRFLSTPFPIFQLVTLQPPSSLFFLNNRYGCMGTT